jgi:hypothetical protein
MSEHELSPDEMREAEIIESCAKFVEDFPWILPLFESREVNLATDDAACAVQEQIAAGIRNCARSILSKNKADP